MAKYGKAQCIAFEIRPGTKEVKGETKYLGAATATDDIEARCAFMIAGVKKAYDLAQKHKPKPQKVARGVSNSVDTDPVLKIFMAPEFFYRNVDGAYPIEKVSEILPKLRKETDDEKYKDWLFVFGTAIGYLDQPNEIYARIRAVEKDGSGFSVISIGPLPHEDWVNGTVEDYPSAKLTAVERGTGDEVRLTMDRDPGLKVGDDVHFDPDGAASPTAVRLKVKAAGPHPRATAKTTITVEQKIQNPCPTCGHYAFIGGFDACRSCHHSHRAMNVGDAVHAVTAARTAKVTAIAGEKITLDAKSDYKAGDYVRLKREGGKKGITEIQNVAIVQRGGPDPGTGGLRSAIIYKEQVSQIDFVGPYSRDVNAFNEATGEKRIIKIHGEERLALATVGSTDSVGPLKSQPNPLGKTTTWTDKTGTHTQTTSEINKSGIGGGSVFTMDGITFGLEVCLDHLCERLTNFYTNHAASGDPKVQIQLIPSWGMSIKKPSICCVDDGIVFNVDGSRHDSHLRINDGGGDYSCSTHDDESTTAGPCTSCRLYFCPTHNASTGEVFTSAAAKCSMCTTPLSYYDDPSNALAQIGKVVRRVAGPDSVRIWSLTKKWLDYFENKGRIVVYPQVAIPAAETVP